MKNIIKKFSSILCLVLVIMVVPFVFAACGDKGKNNGGNGAPQTMSEYEEYQMIIDAILTKQATLFNGGDVSVMRETASLQTMSLNSNQLVDLVAQVKEIKNDTTINRTQITQSSVQNLAITLLNTYLKAPAIYGYANEHKGETKFYGQVFKDTYFGMNADFIVTKESANRITAVVNESGIAYNTFDIFYQNENNYRVEQTIYNLKDDTLMIGEYRYFDSDGNIIVLGFTAKTPFIFYFYLQDKGMVGIQLLNNNETVKAFLDTYQGYFALTDGTIAAMLAVIQEFSTSAIIFTDDEISAAVQAVAPELVK